MSNLQVRDKVKVIDARGVQVCIGLIVNVNDWREPDVRYAVDIGLDDVIFCGKEQLETLEEGERNGESKCRYNNNTSSYSCRI